MGTGFSHDQKERQPIIPHEEISQQVRKILEGDVRTVARTLTQVENDNGPRVTRLLQELFVHTGKSFVIGVTGSPGAGKSTLVNQLAHRYHAAQHKVGIVAVDPTSPFSGGAVLGDRIRMQSLSAEPDIFIRSMATRGKMGGLSPAVSEALLVLDAAGYQVLIVETVGVGQDEIDIVKTADVTVVMLVPGMGDEIQTVKAGIMEIADLFVINKADREGVLQTEQEIAALLSISSDKDGWVPPVVKTVATRGEGVDELVDTIERYRFVFHRSQREKREVRRSRERLLEMLHDRVQGLVKECLSEKELDQYAKEIAKRKLNPYTVIDRLLRKVGVEARK